MNNQVQSGPLLDAVFKAAVDAIVLADECGVMVDVNPATCAMFQRSREELIGHNVKILMPEILADQHDGFIQHHKETREKRIIGIGRDVEGQRKDSTVFPLHLSVGNAQVDDRRMFVAILHDLTQRKATLEALSRSQRMDAVGKMTGGIAHDFNNLLSVIIGNLELLQMRHLNDAMAPLIKDALDAAEMGADLTSRLMIFARRSNLKPVEVDLRALCEDTLAILKRTLVSQVRITTEYAPKLRRVMIDPVQFQSALMNLALNARDAMDEKGELLIAVNDVAVDDTYVAQEIGVEPGDYVRVSVSDNGAGMDEEAQKRAFEPFFTTKENKGGTGLGLAMVYGFVGQSGGHITLYSELGLGTSFGLYFPALPDVDDVQSLASFGKAAAEKTEIGKGLTVLIVEDNPKVRKLALARIEDLGFQTAEAANGDQAYALLKDGFNADILFCDLVMPGSLNGYDLAEKVAREFPKIKLLLTSGYVSDVVTQNMANAEHYEILHKPYRQSDLARRLQALLLDVPES
jgi:PAS domain S-box-containing protein